MAPSEVFDKRWTVVDTDNTVSSTGSNYDDFTPTGETRSGSSYTVSYNHYSYKDDCYELEEKIWKTILLEEMKSGWCINPKNIKPNKIRRQSIQLRNVCADGRGWLN